MADILKMFDVYKTHLNMIHEMNKTEVTDEYICPICLKGYGKKDILELSLEDAPQQALGGQKIAITCKECNNTCGHSIDYHLINMLDYIEISCFLSGTDHRIKILNLDKEKPINALMEVKGKDDIKLIISEHNNNPYTLKERLNQLVDGKEITIQNKTIKVNIRNASAAIIKNAYIILIAKLGFSFILDKHYDRIRNRIFHEKTHEIITNIININQISGKEEPIIPQELSDLLINVRNNIIKENKDKLIMLE